MRSYKFHEIGRVKLAQSPSQTLRFAETCHIRVGSCHARRPQNKGDRMPTVGFQDRRCRMVASNYQNVRIQLQYPWNYSVNFFDFFHLCVKVPVFTSTVRIFIMNKKEIITSQFCRRASNWSSRFLRPSTMVMPTRLASPLYIGYTAIAAALHLEDIFKLWEPWLARPSTQGNHVCGMLVPIMF